MLQDISHSYWNVNDQALIRLLQKCPKLRSIEVQLKQITSALNAELSKHPVCKATVIASEYGVTDLSPNESAWTIIHKQLTFLTVPFYLKLNAKPNQSFRISHPTVDSIDCYLTDHAELEIHDCPTLKKIDKVCSKTTVRHCQQVQRLRISHADTLIIEDLPNLNCLECDAAHLRVRRCPELTQIHRYNFRSVVSNMLDTPIQSFECDAVAKLEIIADCLQPTQVKQFPRLKQLLTRDPEVFEAALKYCHELETLELKLQDSPLKAYQITNKIQQSRCSTTLRELSLNIPFFIDDAAWDTLAQLPKLERLAIRGVVLRNMITQSKEETRFPCPIT